jgi:alpha-L-arabinofuranosidase
MTGLMEFGGIWKKRGRVYVTPRYWAFVLYANHAGDTPVATRTEVQEYDVHGGQDRVPEIPNVPQLDVPATTDSARHDLALFVVNRNWRTPIPARIQITGFHPAALATAYTLNAASILSKNDEEHLEAVHPVRSTIQISGESFPYTFLAHSLSVVFGPR